MPSSLVRSSRRDASNPQKVDPGTPPRPVTRVETEPDGWVQKEANADLGINGFWYSYGDQYDEPRRCTVYGKHSADECSMVTLPNPLPALDFRTRAARCARTVVRRR